VILQGDLKDFSLADLLQLLLQQRKSGILLLAQTKEKADITLSQGMITGVRVGGITPELRIRDMLIELGRVGRKEMTELEAVSVNMNRPLLATLTAKGYLPEEERDRMLAVASEDMVFDLFTWTEGRYEFGTSQKGIPSGPSNMQVSTEFACMEGMRRIDELPRLREQVADDKLVFFRTDKACDVDDVWEKTVYEIIDGRMPLGAVLKRLPFGYFRLLECVVNLWNAGCIAPLEGAVTHVEAAPVADPRSERDQKTALVLGISALILIVALVFRFVAVWVMQASGSDGVDTPEARVESAALRRNATGLLVGHLSETGALPSHLTDLVKRGDLAAHEIRGPEGARIQYSKVGDRDFVLK
jgi:Domain of unknown function (DUF4388)